MKNSLTKLAFIKELSQPWKIQLNWVFKWKIPNVSASWPFQKSAHLKHFFWNFSKYLATFWPPI